MTWMTGCLEGPGQQGRITLPAENRFWVLVTRALKADIRIYTRMRAVAVEPTSTRDEAPPTAHDYERKSERGTVQRHSALCRRDFCMRLKGVEYNHVDIDDRYCTRFGEFVFWRREVSFACACDSTALVRFTFR